VPQGWAVAPAVRRATDQAGEQAADSGVVLAAPLTRRGLRPLPTSKKRRVIRLAVFALPPPTTGLRRQSRRSERPAQTRGDPTGFFRSVRPYTPGSDRTRRSDAWQQTRLSDCHCPVL